MNFASCWSLFEYTSDTFVADGDSITDGNGHTPYTSFLTLDNSSTVLNESASGFTLHELLDRAPTAIDPLFTEPITKSIEVIWAGTNDFADVGSTPASVYSDLTSYVAARHAKGWYVIVATMISRSGNNPVGGETLDADKNSYNTLILANTAHADAIANFTGTNLGCDGCYSDMTYFDAGGVHPNEFSIMTIEAPVISTAANGLIQ